MQIQITETTAAIDALEAAIDVMTHARDNGQMSFQYANESISELQMMLVAYRLVERNAAAEQRKNRAKTAHPFKCGCPECMPAMVPGQHVVHGRVNPTK